MSSGGNQSQTGNRAVEASGGGAIGTLLVQAFQLIGDPEYRNLAISAVPALSVISGYLIHVCYQFLSIDWPLVKMNRSFDKAEKRLRRQLSKKGVSDEEREVINEQLTVLQKLRSDSEITRIKENIQAAPESPSG